MHCQQKTLVIRRTYLEKVWATVDQDKLFDFAKVDEVSSHVAFILKASDLKYDPKWDKEHDEVDQSHYCFNGRFRRRCH